MSPRPVDMRVRRALLDAAARVLANEGPDALTTRRLATEVGTSTMAVYTHFGGMDELRRAVRIEWFQRLAEHLARVPRTADPVSDLGSLGWAYFFSAVENEHLFRVTVIDPVSDPEVAALGMEAFTVLAEAVQRCMDEGRMTQGHPPTRALQIWMMGNGVLAACLAGFTSVESAIDHFYAMAVSLVTTFGDNPVAAQESLARGRRRMDRAKRNGRLSSAALTGG